MRQLTYVAPKTLEWWDVPTPVIEADGEAIVRPTAVARCDLDFYIATGRYRTPGPFALGHEIAGVVEEIGDAVQSFSPGDRVIVPFQLHCGDCGRCRRGWTNACERLPACAAFGLGTGDFGGGLSERLKVPFADPMLVPIPDGMSDQVACGLSDNVADGLRTVAPHLARFPQEPVLVVGGLAQSVGLYAVQAAVALGSRRVVYTDFDPRRLALAGALGAEGVAADYRNERRSADDFLITVDASGMQDGLSYALLSTAPCGFCTGVSGGTTPTTELPLSSAYLRGLTYEVSRVHARATLDSVVEHVHCGRLDPLSIVSRTAFFDEAAEAMFDAAAKVIFVHAGSS